MVVVAAAVVIAAAAVVEAVVAAAVAVSIVMTLASGRVAVVHEAAWQQRWRQWQWEDRTLPALWDPTTAIIGRSMGS